MNQRQPLGELIVSSSRSLRAMVAGIVTRWHRRARPVGGWLGSAEAEWNRRASGTRQVPERAYDRHESQLRKGLARHFARRRRYRGMNSDRRARERAARRQLITTAARRLADAGGWHAVTTRRLCTEIGYSQPVLYEHFSSMEKLLESVAVQGSASAPRRCRRREAVRANSHEALRRVAYAFPLRAGQPGSVRRNVQPHHYP